MNLRILIFLSGLFLSATMSGQTAIDTIYYDKHWKGCEQPFASYYRIYTVPTDSSKINRLRDFYITGELKAESNFITIDPADDAHSVLDGEFTTYYKNGGIEEKGTLNKNKRVGEYTQYREDGLVIVRTSYLNGKIHGLYTEFTDNDDCIQREYSYGKPIYDYYVLSNKDGLCSKVDAATHQPIYESPTLEEKKIEYNDEVASHYYMKNGLTISLSKKEIRDYGKYFQLSVLIGNDSMFPVEFDPADMTATLINKKGEEVPLKVYSAKEYEQKVRNRQNLAIALTSVGSGIAIGCSDFASVNVTNTYHTRSGVSISTSTGFDAASAFQAQVLAAGTIIGLSHALHKDRTVKERGYLKKMTILPGETISGHLNIERRKGTALTVTLNMYGAEYVYPWDLVKK